MDKMESSATQKSFEEIVKYNNFNKDVLAPVIAAEDMIVRSTTSLINSNKMPSDEAAVQNIYMDLEKFVVSKYGLPAELSDFVFGLCGDMLRRGDFEREQA